MIHSGKELRNSRLYEQMYITRSKMTLEKRAATVNLMPVKGWTHPHSAEREYTAAIKKYLNQITGIINTYALENYTRWRDGYQGDSSLHNDGFKDFLKGAKEALRNVGVAFGVITGISNSINRANARQWNRQVQEATGVDMQFFDAVTSKYITEWADKNYKYLGDLPDQYIGNINQIIVNGVAGKFSKAEIADAIFAQSRLYKQTVRRGEVAEGVIKQSRANKIAADQVGKLNSSLSRARMKDAMLDIYEWDTAGDERVRGNPFGKNPGSKYSHYMMDGKYKQVDNAYQISSDGRTWRRVRGREEPRHAGQANNCRCAQIASFIALKKQVDKDLKSAGS